MAEFDAITFAADIDISQMPRGRITRSRLKVRAQAIWGMLLGCGSDVQVLTELNLEDRQRRLRGRLDVLVRGPNSLRVIDLKTNATVTPNGTLAADLRFQLLFYAGLVESSFGQVPDTVEAFSLVDGHHVMPVQEIDVTKVRTKVRVAQEQWIGGDRVAEPEEGTCKFCPRRLECDPHWNVPRVAGLHDSIEGKVIRAVSSDDASLSLLLETVDGVRWLNALKSDSDEMLDVSTGRRIRAIHVYESSRTARHEQEARVINFRATGQAELAFVRPD